MCPNWGLNPQARHVLWLGIELAIFWFAGCCQTNQVTLARAMSLNYIMWQFSCTLVLMLESAIKMSVLLGLSPWILIDYSVLLYWNWVISSYNLQKQTNTINSFSCSVFLKKWQFELKLCNFLFFMFFTSLYCCSSTVVSIFPPPPPQPEPSLSSIPDPNPQLGFVHVSFIDVPENPSTLSPHYPLPPPLWLLFVLFVVVNI